MASEPTARTEYVLFNVYYEDGSQRSNRRVPAELLGGIDGDEPARKLVEEQDREISDKSGTPPLRIDSTPEKSKPSPTLGHTVAAAGVHPIRSFSVTLLGNDFR